MSVKIYSWRYGEVKNMKIFISQPMKGKTAEEISCERKKAIDLILKKYDGAEIIDSVCDTTGKKPLECLGDSLKAMSSADVVVFINEWRFARGCKIENKCAKEYGYATITLDVDKGVFK